MFCVRSPEQAAAASAEEGASSDPILPLFSDKIKVPRAVASLSSFLTSGRKYTDSLPRRKNEGFGARVLILHPHQPGASAAHREPFRRFSTLSDGNGDPFEMVRRFELMGSGDDENNNVFTLTNICTHSAT